MIIIGGLLIALGILDFGLSWVGVDLYGELGIPLSGFLYENSAYFAGVLGGLLIFWKKHSEKGEGALENLNEGEIVIEKRTVNFGPKLNKQTSGILILTNQRFMLLSTGSISNDGNIDYDESQGDVVIPVQELNSVKKGFARITITNRNGDEYKISPGPWAVGSLSGAVTKVISD
jgi:hypothetical protein